MNIQKSFAESQRGTLYLVGTPIGNLEDMTFRAVRVLKEADLIAAEDTRQTRKLLSHYEISGRLVSYHEHNKAASGPELVRLMAEGQSVALVSDAGMPAISDPGYDLVRLAIAEGIPVVPVPGANAALAALITSGLATDRFLFVGFLPREKRKLQAELAALAGAPATLLFYESPHRVVKTLAAMQEAWGDRQAALVREITKRHEEAARGTLSELSRFLTENPPLGEYVIVVDRWGSQDRGEAGSGIAAGERPVGVASGNAAMSDPERDASGDGEHAECNTRAGALNTDAGPLLASGGAWSAAGAVSALWWQPLSVKDHVSRYEADGLDRKDAMKKAAADRGVSKRDIYRLLLEP
ncbi:16S rRNA (cytidine(1402)-2'-O)-methyltransferase [Gorillibacterium massiliense]|uniref:16S rRNA (cytidine(1402)-2'-O)-methyltransferase n=1 Tax=Gorillibacterium massiliense TaxID=1280390 RepID=UPI0004B63FAA|nr:16S rRNA (cytidine(1402)-2'-O)-methyltransferase [Gorillibacterium massiliense]